MISVVNITVRGVYIERGALDPVEGSLMSHGMSMRLTPREVAYVLRQARGQVRRDREKARCEREAQYAREGAEEASSLS